MRRLIVLFAAGAGLFLGAGAAHAQGASARGAAALVHGRAGPSIPMASVRFTGAPPDRPAGVASTALEGAFAGRAATASVGFLCGRGERVDSSGGMGAFGSDPHGRFVGAKLRLSFR